MWKLGELLGRSLQALGKKNTSGRDSDREPLRGGVPQDAGVHRAAVPLRPGRPPLPALGVAASAPAARRAGLPLPGGSPGPPPHQSHPTAKALECVWTIVRMFVPGTPSHNLLCPLPVLTTKMDAIFCPVGVGILGDGVRSYPIWCKTADLWMLFFILLVPGRLATFKRFSDLISEKAAATRQSGSGGGGCRRGNLVIF